MFFQLNDIIWRHFENKFIIGLIKNKSSTKNQNFDSLSFNFEFRAEVKKVMSRVEPSQAENPSAQAMA